MSAERPFVRGWGMKLLALLLAWGVWYVVREDLDEPRDVRLHVVAQTVAGGAIDGEVQEDMVAVKIRGPRRDVEFLVNEKQLIAPVRADDLTVDQNSGTKTLRAEDLLLPEALVPGSVRIVEMTPATVTVRLRRMERRPMTLRPPELRGIEDLNVQVERKRWPQKAVVRGPADQLGTLALETAVEYDQLRRAVEAMGDATRATVTLPLTLLNAPSKNFTVIEPRVLEMSLDLVRESSATLTLPLAILQDANGPARRVRVSGERPWIVAGDPPQVVLELRGSSKSLAAATPQSVRAFILASDLPDGADQGEVPLHTADLPAGAVLVRDDLVVPVQAVK